ncbi:hypothetical protein AB1Y20_018637 [Prymnesium parvum]|uniref:Amino acid transporter transmembrane domain-containing protein n=1 Tax=Prymnesium parvum TaxID=97485 RepID=A0AB34JRQ7_PRYPA
MPSLLLPLLLLPLLSQSVVAFRVPAAHPPSRPALRHTRLAAAATILPGDGDALTERGPEESTAPCTVTTTINLSKNIMCGGFLSLPAGVAYCSVAPTARTLIPASIAMVSIGALSAYCFALIGRTCALENQSTYHGAWTSTAPDGSLSGSLVKGSLLAKTGVTCLSYSMILADMRSAVSGAGRAISLLRVTSLGILPLCMLDTTKTLGALKYTSFLGLAATVYIVSFMGLRWLGGAYAAGGHFYAQLPPHLAPSFAAAAAPGLGLSMGALVLLSMLATAFMAHYNAPAFMRDATGASVETQSDGSTSLSPVGREGMRRFGKVVTASFLLAWASFALVATFGFLTFGAASAGNILTNYARNDLFARGARVALALSLLAGYPLAFTSLRDSALEMCGGEQAALSARRMSLTLLAAITAAASWLTDLGFVSAFAGALLGSAVIYLYPSIMFRRALRRQVGDGSVIKQRRLRLELVVSYMISFLGVAFMICGGGVTLFSKLGH